MLRGGKEASEGGKIKPTRLSQKPKNELHGDLGVNIAKYFHKA